jgi:Glycosyltransferase family 9 (heptosyltransferase)
MRDLDSSYCAEALPELDPVVAYEITDYGWRGLTAQGEIYEVKGSNGHRVEVPSEIIVARGGKPFGRRAIRNERAIDIEAYLSHFNRAVDCYKQNRLECALVESDLSLKAFPTLRGKFNRAMVLLASGRWSEGLAEYLECEQHAPFMRPQVRDALDRGMQPWRGESLRGKKLLLLHAHGFGDTIQMLRYVKTFRSVGARVVVALPPELQSLAKMPFSEGADYFCPILHLLHFLHVKPENVDGRPYLAVDGKIAQAWRTRIQSSNRKVGVAWSVGKPSAGDYPRAIPLWQLVEMLGERTEIHSVQMQNADEARELGVHVHQFADFENCAALMLRMDAIISVDTAALHLAGAIGHPNVTALLSHWHSWRWLAPWYERMKFCRQPSPDDWDGALKLLDCG